jgi:hypothetical protein
MGWLVCLWQIVQLMGVAWSVRLLVVGVAYLGLWMLTCEVRLIVVAGLIVLKNMVVWHVVLDWSSVIARVCLMVSMVDGVRMWIVALMGDRAR